MKNLRIFVDMDNVLVDFDPGACRVHGVSYDRMMAERRPGEWDMTRALGLKSHNEFWKPINEGGSQFWEELQPLPWANELIGMVSCLTSDWHVITAPSLCPTSYNGKVKWLKNFFGSAFDQFCITPHKEIFAHGQHTILIDDREKNCDKFREAGGRSILFPSHGNNLHAWKHEPITIVDQELIGVRHAL